MLDEFLQKYGLKYEDLDKKGFSGERETLNKWLDTLSKNQITVEGIKIYIQNMRYSVEMELTKTGLNKQEDTFLKARLRNYMLLEAFLVGPEKAKEQLVKNLKELKKS